MSRTGWFRRAAGWPARLALPLVAAVSAGLGSPSEAQETPAPVTTTVVAAPAAPVLPEDVQVIRFQGPTGVKLEVLGPAPEAVPPGDGQGLATVGLKVGVGYHLRLSNLPDRPGVELFPVIEIVGHLHRPPGIDPAKYPIRVVFRDDDLDDSVARGRMVTQVVYLEDPEVALPLKLGKDEPPVVTLNPAEEPFKVARALGRVMAIVRIGGRQPTVDELAGPQGIGMPVSPCPFVASNGGPCKLPCGPACGSPPPAGRPWMPRDEFLCDGGDQGTPVRFAGDGGLAGIDPRDTVVNFNAGDRPRILPTNTVCVYAPRFASVRTSVGVSEALNAAQARQNEILQKQETSAIRQGPKKMAQNQVAAMNRLRTRATGLASRTFAGEHFEIRVLGGFDSKLSIVSHQLIQGADRKSAVQTPVEGKHRVKIDGIKSAEGPVVTGIVEGAGQTVMSWPPLDVTGVEVPPNKPGLAVIKRVSAEEAEPGDKLTYTIQYRNMGNLPIRAVSIIDSLLPRLEYVPGTAQGPAGTVFTAGENKAGALELRYDLPGAIAPGAEGAVSFQTIVR